jgi:hypothetical protein
MDQNTRDYWISLSYDLKPQKYFKPVQDSQVFIWIHKYFDRYWDADTPMFKYEIFSSELSPIQLGEGNFTCTELEDFCKSIGCGNHYSIKFGIIDKKNELRVGYGIGQQENGIIETIKLLRELASYEDWEDYYKKKSK